MVAFAVVGGALSFTTLYDHPAKANASARTYRSALMANAKNLPVAQYDDYSVVFNLTPGRVLFAAAAAVRSLRR